MLPARLSSRFTRFAWVVLAADAALFFMFLGGLLWLWRSVPEEGVKLHGTISTGVDLLGSRTDLLWVGGLGALAVVGNGLLAWLVAPRESVAAMYLLVVTAAVLVLLVGVLLFLADLNRLR